MRPANGLQRGMHAGDVATAAEQCVSVLPCRCMCQSLCHCCRTGVDATACSSLGTTLHARQSRSSSAGANFLACLLPALCAGKWPDELEPYQKMKAALGCQLAQQLHTALGLDAHATEVRGAGLYRACSACSQCLQLGRLALALRAASQAAATLFDAGLTTEQATLARAPNCCGSSPPLLHPLPTARTMWMC